MVPHREIPYRRLFEMIDEGFCIIEKVSDRTDQSLDFRFVEANSACAVHSGVYNLVGKTFHEAFPDDKAQAHIHDAVFHTGIPVRFEKTLVCGRVLDVYAFRFDDEPPYRGAILFKDITERKTAEHALRDSEQFIRNVLDSTPDCIVLSDLEGHMQFLNEPARKAAEACNLTAGQRWQDLWKDPQERITAQEAHAHALTGQRGMFDGHIENSDGNITWWEVLISQVPDDCGRPIQLLALARDITNRKTADQNRERLMRELERSNIDLSQYAHLVAHDLQAPVRTIGTLVQLLEERHRADQEINTMVVAATDRMGLLVRSLLDFAKVGHAQLRPEVVRVNDVIDVVRNTLAPLIAQTRTEIKCDSLPTIQADRIQLEQLFQNLLCNAIKFRREGIAPSVRMSAELVESGWQFAFTDNGQGISPDQQQSVFEPLKRFAKDEVPGCGLGLSVCRTIVERHGGSIWVESEPGQGSTFKFTLPATVPQHLSDTQSESAVMV